MIAEIKAKTKTILTAERTALNFLNHASGIATITNQFVKKINGSISRHITFTQFAYVVEFGFGG